MYNLYLEIKKGKEKEEKIKIEQEQKLFQLKHKSKYFSQLIN